MQVEPLRLIASRNEVFDLMVLRSKLPVTTVKVFTLNKEWEAYVKRSEDKVIIDNGEV